MIEPGPEIPQKDVPDDPPPVLGAWRNVYIFVLVYLAVVIFALYVFTVSFS